MDNDNNQSNAQWIDVATKTIIVRSIENNGWDNFQKETKQQTQIFFKQCEMDADARTKKCARAFMHNMVIEHDPRLMPVIVQPGSRPPMLIENHWEVHEQWLMGQDCCHCGGGTCVGLFTMKLVCQMISQALPKEKIGDKIRAAAKEWMEHCVVRHYNVPAISNLVGGDVLLELGKEFSNKTLYSVSDMPQCTIAVLHSFFPLDNEEK